MAEQKGTGSPSPQDEYALLPGQEEDVLFKVQMALANAFLGYWKHGLVVIGVVLVVALVVGEVIDHRREVQREAQARIARIDLEVPPLDQLALLGLTPGDDPTDAERMAALAKAAEQYEAVATDTSGTGAVMAWLRAAETWDRAGQADRVAKAYAAADGAGAPGVVGWAAASGRAMHLVETGDVDGAAAILRRWADLGTDALSQRALYQLGNVYEGAGRTDDARKVYDEFAERFEESPLAPDVARARGRLGGTTG